MIPNPSQQKIDINLNLLHITLSYIIYHKNLTLLIANHQSRLTTLQGISLIKDYLITLILSNRKLSKGFWVLGLHSQHLSKLVSNNNRLIILQPIKKLNRNCNFDRPKPLPQDTAQNHLIVIQTDDYIIIIGRPLGKDNFVLLRLIDHFLLKTLLKLSPDNHQSLYINTEQFPILIIPGQNPNSFLVRLFKVLIHNNIYLSLFLNSTLLKSKQFNLSILKPKGMDITLMIIAISRDFSFLAKEYLLVLIYLHYNFL